MFFLAAHFAKRNTKFGGGKKLESESEGGQKFLPPNPFLFARPSYWISEFAIRIFVKKSSNFVQKTPPSFTFSEIVRCCLGALRLGMVFPRENPSIFERERKRPLGNAEVPVRKHRVPRRRGRTNLFYFAFSERLSVFFFDCPKTNFKTIWTT
ncbi:MAG: hypothetical protein HZA35_01500 [Parcubacteria group bacterium]|nr:hypothetical protein [Parcubacteria group bacterium]